MGTVESHRPFNKVRYSRPISVDPGRWHPWDAMRTAMADQLPRVSELVGLSDSYLEKWRLPPNRNDNERGIPSPLARLHDVMTACHRAGVPLEKVIAPLVWLAHKWGYELSPRQPNVDGGRPFTVLHKLASVSGQGEALLAEVLDPSSPGGSAIVRMEAIDNRERALAIAEQHEQAARDIRSLFEVDAA